jgi:RNA polymerase sigma-54 factor
VSGYDLRPRQSLHLQQQMLLQPRMLQSIAVLQLASADLVEYVEVALQENEALRRTEAEPESWRPTRANEAGRRASDQHQALLANAPDREPALFARVIEQLAWHVLEPGQDAWVRFVGAALDDQGLLAQSDEELLAQAALDGLVPDAAALGRAIAFVQRLEPRGIGARSAIEALLLQLDPHDPDYTFLCALLEDFLEELARNKLPVVARALGIDMPRLGGLMEKLRGLELRPVAELTAQAAEPIVPDVLVSRVGDGFEVAVDGASFPALTLEPEVVAQARDRSEPRELRAHLRAKIEEARWLIDAVENRRDTLLRVARAVFIRQREFLEHGPGHLQPLRMREVAEELGLAVSTISRAVAEKYADTPHGVWALKHFFQASSGGEEAARDDVREILRELFAAEDAALPLSDDDVVAVMAGKGHKLARRTVAKHRNDLGIPSSYRRRKFA